MAESDLTPPVFEDLRDGNMVLQGPSHASLLDQPCKTCVLLDREKLLASSAISLLTKAYFTVSLPLSHPVFSADTVHVLPPFSSRTGGIPLRTFGLNDTTTFVAHASGDDLHAEQFEVIWQFKLFAQDICLAAISETTKADILTLGGSEKAPRRSVGEYTGEEHYLGWKGEHFKRFFDEYTRSSPLQAYNSGMSYTAADWQDLQIPRWLSTADLSGLCKTSTSALDRSLQESISDIKKEPTQAQKGFKYRRDVANKGRNGKLPRPAGLQSRSIGNRRDRANKKGNSMSFSVKNQGPANRPRNICNKNAWYRGTKAASHRKDMSRNNQKRSMLPPPKPQLNKSDSPMTPISSLRDTIGLGPAISKTKKPYHSISAQFQTPKPSNTKTPLTQSVRDFIAHKTEQQLLIAGSQKEAILHIIRTVSPNTFQKRRNGRLFDYRNMSDNLYLQLARLISDSSPSSPSSAADTMTPTTTNPKAENHNSHSSQILTPEMVRFTRENILKLPAERQRELAFITERTVPSVDALPDHWAAGEKHALEPEELPVENQIMISRFVGRFLVGQEEGGGAGAAGRMPGEDPAGGEGGGWS